MVFVLALVVLASWQLTASAAGQSQARFVALSLAPGQQRALALDGLELVVSVPSGRDESASCGTFRVSAAGFDSGPLPRDGAVEGGWIADLDRDGRQEAVIVVRSAGSGSYIELFLIDHDGPGVTLLHLPPPSPGLLAGTMGHDVIGVQEGQLVRTLPTYAAGPGLRLDRQWRPGDALEGQLPLKSEADANATPSGADVSLVYDLATRAWRALD